MVVQLVKNPPDIQETLDGFLGLEVLLEEGIFLLEDPHGQRSLANYSLWGCKC